MRKIINKANSKWILLFLFTLFTIGVKGQWNENGDGGSYGEMEEYNDGFVPSYHTGGTYVNGVNEFGVERTKIGNGENIWFTNSNGDLVIVPQPIYSYSYVNANTYIWNPYLGNSNPDPNYYGAGTGSNVPSIAYTGNKPITKAQFDNYINNSWSPRFNCTSKNNQIITTSDGKTHVGVLYFFIEDGPNPHKFYYFTPNASDSQYSKDLYYFIPEKLGASATTNTGGTTTLGKLGINYTSDNAGFPRGQGYMTNTVGTEVGIFLSQNVSAANLENYQLPLRSIYKQKFELEYPLGDILYKTVNNIPIFASIYEQLMYDGYGNMGSDKHSLLNYYKTKVNTNSSITSDSNIIHAELKSYLAGNGSMSTSSQEFIDWLVSVSAIQIGAANTNFEILKAPEFSSAFGEDDDFAKSTDPFFTNKTDDPWRLKNLLSPDDSYVVGFLAGLGDGCIETADLAYTLVKFGLKNQPPVLLYRLVTDTENTIKEKIEEIKVVKDLVSLVYDKPRQDLIFNSIKAEVGDWFDAATFQKTDVQAGYAQGKIVFEIVGSLLGVAEVKALLKTGQFTASAIAKLNKLSGAFRNGLKLKKINKVSHLVDNLGNPISKGDEVVRVINNLADPVNDVQKTLINQFKAEVDSYVDTVGDFINKRKGNWGEMATDVKLSEKGYIPLHRRVTSIDDAGHNGIDGVFEKDGKYFIVESKYSKTGTPSLNPANEPTGLPKQMSDDWIRRPGELENAIGDPVLADKILKTQYTRVLVTHGPNGTVTYRLVNADGTLGGVFTP